MVVPGSIGILRSVAIQASPVAWTDVVTAVGVAVLAILGLAVAVQALLLLRVLMRTTRTLQRTVDRMSPRIEPLVGNAARLADDASEITRSVRRNVENVNDTVEQLNRQLHEAVTTAEVRVRRFGAVLEAVQDETEKLLLDATATARGMHATADALRKHRPDGRGRGGSSRSAGADGHGGSGRIP